MKRFFALALALLVVCSLQAFGQKQKKAKQKSFEPVVKQNFEDYVGRYDGPDAEHFIEVRVDDVGRWIVTMHEGARTASLRNIRVDNARLTGQRVYEDGSTREFEAVFGNRVLNGERAFGLLVDLNWEVAPGVTIQKAFYKRQ